MKAKLKKVTRPATVRGISPIKSFTLEDIRRIVREELAARFEARKAVADEAIDRWHRCDDELPPSGVTLEIAYGMMVELEVSAQQRSTAYAIREDDGWRIISCEHPRDDMQHPLIWRRPVHRERRAA